MCTPRPEVHEWLEANKGRRHIFSSQLPSIERGRCRWCGRPCPGRRYHWCSDECLDAFERIASVNIYRVARAHNWTCRRCGVDVHELKEAMDELRNERNKSAQWRRGSAWHKLCRLMGLTNSHDCYRVHHKKPLWDGGDNRMGNLELLCQPCHLARHGKGDNNAKG